MSYDPVSMAEFSVDIVAWNDARPLLRAVRETVFVHEQRVPVAEEWDVFDEKSTHVLATDRNGSPIGTGRLLPDGHVGRMAVLAHWRGRGVGAALLERLLMEAKHHGHAKLLLNAQTHAVRFYERFGFEAVGDEFMEAGIPHRAMERVMRGPPWRVQSS
ncbi:MAG: GNAT family N-acetyltransferase [Myxococcota bacterium]